MPDRSPPNTLENLRLTALVDESPDGAYALDVHQEGTVATTAANDEDVGSALLRELRILNLHMACITGEHFSRRDVG